jgi:hypothetical protein
MEYLYVMETNVMPRLKIGVSNNPQRRRREIERTIQAQHGKDKFVSVLWTKEIDNAYDVELQTHFYLKATSETLAISGFQAGGAECPGGGSRGFAPGG